MTLRFCPYKIGRICWQILALILVLFALLVSLIRGLLPQLDELRLEQYVEQNYGVKVELGQLSAKWQAYGPSVSVNSVELPQQKQLPVTLAVRNVQVKLDFWQTLLTLKPQVENVNFGSVFLTLDLDKISHSSASDKEASDKSNLDWLYALLLEQLEQYSIDDATVQLVSASHQYQPIHLRQLRWLNHGELHRASGALYLDETPAGGEHLSLNVDLKGNGNKPDSINGQVYLAANQLNLGAWASERSKVRNEPLSIPVQGVVNLQAWFDVKDRAIGNGLIKLGDSALDWQQQGDKQSFKIDGGDITWRTTASGWQLTSQSLAFSSNDKPWQNFAIQAKQQDGQFFAHISQIDLQALRPLMPLIPSIKPAALKQLLALNATGSIDAVNLYQGRDQQLQLNVPISHASWQATDAIPGSKPVDLSLSMHGTFLSATLPKQQYQLDFADKFNAPLTFDAEPLDVGFDIGQQRLVIPALTLENHDLKLDAAAAMDFSDTPQLSLSASLQLQNLANAHRYFPVTAMGDSLYSYLKGALKAGKAEHAAVVWRGALHDFPYADHQGVFQASLDLQQGTFAFQPNWPAADKLSLNALFENASMQIHVNQGMLGNVDISGADVAIPSMTYHSHLLVDAKLHANGPDVTAVMNQSPLTSVSSTLNIVQIRDAIDGELHLNIPLYVGGVADVQGQVAFNNTPVYVSKPGVLLNKLNGIVSFHNEEVKSDKLTGLMYQQPVQLHFDTSKVNDNFGVNVKLSGQWELNKLPKTLNNPLTPFYAGKADINGSLQLIFDSSGFRIQANADADMQNASLDMPVPFGKKAGTPLMITAELLGDDKQASLGIRMANLAEFWGSFDVNADNLKHYDMMLGRLFHSGDQLAKQDGKLWLALDETKFDQWQPLIDAFVNNKSASNSDTATGDSNAEGNNQSKNTKRGFFPPLTAIGGNIKQLSMLGHHLTNVTLNAHDTSQSWMFNVDAPEFAGSVEIFPDWWTQGLKIVASRMHLIPEPATDASDDTTTKQPTQLPPLAIDIADFSYQGKAFGHLALQGAPSDKGYHIQTFSLTSPQGTLQGQGDWLTQGENLTHVDFTVDSKNFEQLAAIFDVNPGVKDSPLQLKASIDWKGAPTAFNLRSLNGDVRFDLGKGHMEQLSDKGARIFSLFSLDSILRKLSLDFSDVFGKGLYFNTFGGDLHLDDGILKTTNTEMDAVAGNMKVRGYTDLVSESLNYDIRFAPKLASSVPTVVLLSTSAWTMGIGAFALTKVLEPVIEVISEIRFRLTGTMENPKLEELERKSKEIEIPKSILPADKQTDGKDAEGNSSDESSTDASSNDANNAEAQSPAENATTPKATDNTNNVATDSDKSVSQPVQTGDAVTLQATTPAKATQNIKRQAAANDDVAPASATATNEATSSTKNTSASDTSSTPSASEESSNASQSVTVPEQSQSSSESDVSRPAA